MPTPSFTQHPFLLSVEDVAKQLETDVDKGLTAVQVKQRQAHYGRNELEVQEPTPWYSILIKQFCNAMIIVLFIILGVSFGIGDVIEGGVVAAVIVINVTIGFYQESRAEKKMDALRTLSSPSATVVRDGHSTVVPNADVVPGDVVLLRTGDTVPADARLFESVNLSCDEQLMTGESMPVDKVTHNRILDPTSTSGAVATEAARVTDGDRINLAFASTNVSKGRGRGIVIATGMDTAVGRIAAASSGKHSRKPGRSMNVRKYGPRQAALGSARRLWDLVRKLIGLKDVTPLQRRLTYLAYALFVLAVVIALIVFGVHKFDLNSEVVLYATSTGIALIPESLAIVLIMTMVQATRVMRQANVVVRDLAALELLGGVTNICSDKTGTLTQGAMIVKKAWLPRQRVLTLHGSTDPNDPTTGTVQEDDATRADTNTNNANNANYANNSNNTNDANNEPGDGAAAVRMTPGLRTFLLASALCNAATVRQDPESGEWQAIGEPTEIALQVFAQRFGMGKRALEAAGWTQRTEFPFDSTIKRMSVVYDAPADVPATGDFVGAQSARTNSIVLTKGAVERILERCTSMARDDQDAEGEGECEPMTDAHKETILAQMNTFAPLGLRVLAIAYRPWHGRFQDEGHGEGEGQSEGAQATDKERRDTAAATARADADAEQDLRARVEQDLVFVGLVGIYDPPRVETAPSIRECTDAGIHVHMLTGDHPATAEAIAREVGILPDASVTGTLPADVARSLVLPATAFDALSDAALDALPQLPRVVARCTPETKTRMIDALRRRQAFSAMTGDGVNDAPSLRRADVGIAMGSGSDVAKGAAAIVLADDRFSSIVAAVREGRRMFDNIQKFMLHLLTSNIAEVIVLIIGLSFQDADGFSVFPVSALHILWINIFTSAMPALGLGMEKASIEVMHRPPHGRGIFTRQLAWDMLIYGVVMGAVSLLTFVAVVYGVNGGELGHECNREWSPSCHAVFRARATVFVQLTYLILLSAWEFKDMRRSLFRLNPENPHPFPLNVATDLWANKFLFFSVVIGLIPPIVLVYVPVIGERVMKHRPITWEWGLVFSGIAVFLLAVEGWKYTKRSMGLFDETIGAARHGRRRGGGANGGSVEAGRPPLMQKSVTMSTMQ
ncbi:calcium-transporting ATPase [Sporothrix schenckii 1099-18]|uniref:Calcium-transporting ATPase n=1 Tax=Sporothrix schenckii 1099-18 TaxID=1397361 RepID=A0A0F2M9A3_SPOSC|nr:calcium-transporting ATPase [Sporothrix schenckii 1099-18]KJR86217.1 calcium-transporting ATPase [Sporothrix schenckii 1099-18]